MRRFSLFLALLLAALTAACSAGSGRQAAAPAAPTSPVGTTAAAAAGTSGAGGAPSSGTASSVDPSGLSSVGARGEPAVLSGHLPLWPFASAAEARRWQRSFRAGGHQPWHLSPQLTALSFAGGYLGFTGVDWVTSQVVRGADARIGVGFLLPDRRTSTAAVVHLVRFGTGSDAPWEVVGTRDSTLSLTSPQYGARVSSPIRVGGRITGVDESIAVQVRQSAAESPLGSVCCVPAGGADTPWSTSVRFAGATAPGVLTVVASTGGHVAAVERFAVTGVRVAPAVQPRAVQRSARDGDIDGDGGVDQVTLSGAGVSGAGVLHVRYAAGGTDDVRFQADTGSVEPAVLGVVDADRDGRADVFVRVTSGAATEFASVFRYTGGRLRLVTTGGGQARLGYFGSVVNQSSWACRPPGRPIVTWTGTSTDGSIYRGTETYHRFDGAELVVTGSRPRTVTPTSPAPSGCGSLRLR
jgi:hypothetical protein